MEYQNGRISAEDLKHQRFLTWSEQLNLPTQTLNHEFLVEMIKISEPIEGAIALLNTLKNKVKMGIITNGFKDLQEARLQHNGLTDHFDLLIISEEVGAAKPHPSIFQHALQRMGNPSTHKVLMVGDTLETDILGGLTSGLTTCWYNPSNQSSSETIKPDFQITTLLDLLTHLSEETALPENPKSALIL